MKRHIACMLLLALSSVAGPATSPTGTIATSATPTTESTDTLSGVIVFDNFEDIFSTNADGSGLTQLTEAQGPEFDAEWSPDGKRIVYRDSTRGINDDDEIYVMSADGSGKTNLTNHPANDWGPTWSPDGTKIAFNSDRDGATMSLYIMNADSSNLQRIGETYIEYPDWSPDGTKFVCMCRSAGSSNYEIYVMNVNGSELTRLTDSVGHDSWPVWSPDGSMIAFSSDRDDCAFSTANNCGRGEEPGDFKTIWVMRADGSGLTRLSSVFGQFPAWSPDGRYLVFGSIGGLYRVRPDANDLERLSINGLPGDPVFMSWKP